MPTGWQPKNWEEACKRNAGRRKLHMKNREARADRIVRILTCMDDAPELRDHCYGWLKIAAENMEKSRATASRDFALCRRIHSQFLRIFGRVFKPTTDEIAWSWDWSHYGFITQETKGAGHKKYVGNFPFNTRVDVTEEAYCGLSPRSWIPHRGNSTARAFVSTVRFITGIR
jgi:hypothetical protein